MTFRDLYAFGWQIFVRILPIVMLAIALDYFAVAWNDHDPFNLISPFISVFSWTLIAFYAHRQMIKPVTTLPKAGLLFGGFLWRTLVLMVIVSAPSIVIALLILLEIGGDLHFESDLLFYKLTILMISALFGLVAMALFGTFLPACIAESYRGIRHAIARGKRQFVWIIDRLIFGPGGLAAIAIFLALLVVPSVTTDGPLVSENLIPNISQSIMLVVVGLVKAFVIILTAVVLSSAYLRDPKGTGEILET